MSVYRNRGMGYRVIPPNHVIDVTLSLEEGILLPANPLCNFIISAALARARALYPLRTSHFNTVGSHIHMLAYVEDPETLKNFIGHFKTESAHYINAMLGRRKRTVWCESYCAIPVLTLSRAIEKIVYIYTNPAKDNLEKSIELYPGVSSWQAFRTGRHSKSVKRLHRPMIPCMPERAYSEYEYKKQIKQLKKSTPHSHVLRFEPDAWMEFFGITEREEIERVNEEIVERIRLEEERLEVLRKAEGKSVMGASRLRLQHLNPDYVPERTGVQMWCLCDDPVLRVAYIEWAKRIKEKARAVYERWKRGDFSVSYPPGVFPPAVPKLANMTALACDYQ